MNDDELRARLRAADPAADLAPADPDRVPRLLEATMTQDPKAQDTDPGTDLPGATRARAAAWLLAAAAVLIGGYLTVGLVTGDDDVVAGDDRSEPTSQASASGTPSTDTGGDTTTLTAPGASTARCMVPSAETLRQSATYAFDATVTAIEDERVTLAVSRWYVGAESETVEVTAPSADLQALIGAVAFTEGARYLVAATGEDALMVCGFSAPFDADLAQLYEEAFG